MIAPSGEVQLQFRQDARAPYDCLSYRTSEGGEYRLYGDGPQRVKKASQSFALGSAK